MRPRGISIVVAVLHRLQLATCLGACSFIPLFSSGRQSHVGNLHQDKWHPSTIVSSLTIFLIVWTCCLRVIYTDPINRHGYPNWSWTDVQIQPRRTWLKLPTMPAYSNLFSSGLLAPHQGLCDSRAHTPTPADTPMLTPTTSADPVDRFPTSTPPRNFSSNAMQVSPGPSGNSQSDTHTNTTEMRPRLRKRRSSLSVTTSPKGHIKSPGRSAGHALQRTGLMSPSRMRSRSVGEFGNGNVASEETSLAGRMWSGCTGGILRSVGFFLFSFPLHWIST